MRWRDPSQESPRRTGAPPCSDVENVGRCTTAMPPKQPPSAAKSKRRIAGMRRFQQFFALRCKFKPELGEYTYMHHDPQNAPDGTAPFSACIHRGALQIGGTCIELACGDARLLLDLGLPLDADDTAPETLLPAVRGFRDGGPLPLALVLTHGHRDHWGLAPVAPPGLPVVAGAATVRIMQAAAAFVPGAGAWQPAAFTGGHLTDRQPLHIGPFTITPYLVDHSAYDSYALLIEAAGRGLFYTGDLRAHGRKGALFEALLAHPGTDRAHR